MKKNLILFVLTVIIISCCIFFLSDGIIYPAVCVMGLTIIGFFRFQESVAMRLTRWGKKNPHKAQLLITAIQLILMVFGILTGYNLKKTGFEFTDFTALLFGTIMVFGFFSVHFLPRKNLITLPHVLYRDRVIYTCIAISSFVLIAITGNRLEEKHPGSFITKTVDKIDQYIFPEQNDITEFSTLQVSTRTNPLKLASLDKASGMISFASYSPDVEEETIVPAPLSKKETRAKQKAEKESKKLERKKERMVQMLSKKRNGMAAGLSAGAILLIILLSATLCGGICLMIGGGGVGEVLLGAVVAGGSIFGIIKLSKGSKEKTTVEQ